MYMMTPYSRGFRAVIVLAMVVGLGSVRDPYLQALPRVYPNDTTGDPGTKHLYFGLMQSFGGSFDGTRNYLGVQVALDQINNDPTMLPGYTLHYTLSDSKVSQQLASYTKDLQCRVLHLLVSLSSLCQMKLVMCTLC